METKYTLNISFKSTSSLSENQDRDAHTQTCPPIQKNTNLLYKEKTC